MPARYHSEMKAGNADVLLVIGVHREELAFGERVATVLADHDELPHLELLRIPEGISGQHPRSDQRFRYELLHSEIYRQIEEAARRHRLLIDLHQGEDDHGPCADVICGDARLLQCIHERVTAGGDHGCLSRRDRVRTVQLIGDGLAVAQGATTAHTVIPSAVWNSSEFLFVGLEIYLPTMGAGRQHDWEFTAELVQLIVACAG